MRVVQPEVDHERPVAVPGNELQRRIHDQFARSGEKGRVGVGIEVVGLRTTLHPTPGRPVAGDYPDLVETILPDRGRRGAVDRLAAEIPPAAAPRCHLPNNAVR